MDLAALIETYRSPLIGLIASWGAPWSDAGEIAQDSLAEAWLRRESCRGDWQQAEIFGAWLRGVARNQYRNWSRSRRRHELRFAPITAAAEPVTEIADPRHEQYLDDLRRAIERLPSKSRQVVLMHYLDETSVRDVATLLSLSEKTVEGRLYQARRELRRMLDAQPAASQIRMVLLCL